MPEQRHQNLTHEPQPVPGAAMWTWAFRNTKQERYAWGEAFDRPSCVYVQVRNVNIWKLSQKHRFTGNVRLIQQLYKHFSTECLLYYEGNITFVFPIASPPRPSGFAQYEVEQLS
jgi:hypothetical protein